MTAKKNRNSVNSKTKYNKRLFNMKKTTLIIGIITSMFMFFGINVNKQKILLDNIESLSDDFDYRDIEGYVLCDVYMHRNDDSKIKGFIGYNEWVGHPDFEVKCNSNEWYKHVTDPAGEKCYYPVETYKYLLAL